MRGVDRAPLWRGASALVSAARTYQEAGLWVCIDDVGTGDNQLSLVQALSPYVQEYKFALQNFHDKKKTSSRWCRHYYNFGANKPS